MPSILVGGPPNLLPEEEHGVMLHRWGEGLLGVSFSPPSMTESGLHLPAACHLSKPTQGPPGQYTTFHYPSNIPPGLMRDVRNIREDVIGFPISLDK